MKPDQRKREQMLELCGDIAEGDGVDPRVFFKEGHARKQDDRKAKQLCRQVADTLGPLLSGEMGDDLLRGLHVAGVAPAPDGSRLLVTLYADCKPQEFDRGAIEARLAACRGRLRSEVAAAITRRKTPVLVFNVIGPTSQWAGQGPDEQRLDDRGKENGR